MIVVDTSVIIDGLRLRPAAVSWWAAAQQVSASEISRAEVLQGIRSDEREQRTRQFLDQIEWHPVARDISTRAGSLGREFRRSHQGIDIADFCVAATAQIVQADLVTLNIRHFPMFEGLRPPY